jgi:hypothetical protein
MKPIEFAEKQLKNAEKLKEHYCELYRQTGNIYYLELANEQAKKVEEKQERLKQAQRITMSPVLKELHISILAAHHELEDKKVFSKTEADKATAIIDEIIECELKSHAKLTLIKLFVNDKISCKEIDAILSE